MAHAVRIHATGGPEVLRFEEVAVGEPGPGEARVRHTAIGLNYIDTYHRSGLYPLPLPAGIGGEAAGVVEAVGPGVDWVKPEIALPTPAGRRARMPRNAFFLPIASSCCPTASTT